VPRIDGKKPMTQNDIPQEHKDGEKTHSLQKIF
jgi:hypothetical protein